MCLPPLIHGWITEAMTQSLYRSTHKNHFLHLPSHHTSGYGPMVSIMHANGCGGISH